MFRWLIDLKIRTKMILGLGITMVLIAAMAVVGLSGFGTAQRNIHSIDGAFAVATATDQALLALRGALLGEQQMLLAQQRAAQRQQGLIGRRRHAESAVDTVDIALRRAEAAEPDPGHRRDQDHGDAQTQDHLGSDFQIDQPTKHAAASHATSDRQFPRAYGLDAYETSFAARSDFACRITTIGNEPLPHGRQS